MKSFKDYFFQTTDGLRLFARDYPGPDANARSCSVFMA